MGHWRCCVGTDADGAHAAGVPPLVEETRNQVAIKRGPVVYCLESVDLPDGVAIDDVRLDAGGRFEVSTADRLGGVSLIEADATTIPSKPWESLYRPLEDGGERTLRVRLIPYFAWGNRGPSEMTVWVPRR